MRKKKNNQSIGTAPGECPIENAAEAILPENDLNAPEKNTDGQVIAEESESGGQAPVTQEEADSGLTAVGEEADAHAMVAENEADGNVAVQNAESEGRTAPPHADTEADHQAGVPAPPAVTPSEAIERLTTGHLTDEHERTGVASLLETVFEEFAKGAFSEHTVRQLCQAVNYERDIQDAFRQGEIKGRNYKIEEYLIEHRNQEEVRQLGSSSAPSRPTPPASVIGGLCAADRKSIWERGHERRVCHH